VERLLASGLEPTSKALLVGPPGVGKTLAARYIAKTLELPLFILDLSAVMSSFLGRTGVNVRHVLDFARSQPCVLLLDELDAVAKRRDDVTEIGELKRLVTVLLQEIDDWRSDGLLLAATNHPDLLDPAVWRRFDIKIEFPLPDASSIQKAVPRFLDDATVAPDVLVALMSAFEGLSFSDIERSLMKARRIAALDSQSLEDALLGVVQSNLQALPFQRRAELASQLVASGQISQRRAYELTGVSRDSIRKVQRSRRGKSQGPHSRGSRLGVTFG
jgi:SpoVK/Ycf46/Vps4 family AAA+-type ATPase